MLRVRWSSAFSSLARVTSVSFLVTALSVGSSLIVPLILDPKQYALWQVFSLASAYTGLFMLGFNDGFILNYAGARLEESLNLFRVFRNVVAALSLAAAATVLSLSFMQVEGAYSFILRAMSVYLLTTGLNGYFTYVNQATLRFDAYAGAMWVEKVIFVSIVFLVYFREWSDFRLLVGATVVAGGGKLAYNARGLRSLAFGRGLAFVDARSMVWSNFLNGFLLMCAILLGGSLLIPGRILAANVFGLEVFGVFSFALNMVVLAGLVLTSVADVLFPLLRRKNDADRAWIIGVLSDALTLAGSILLGGYFLVLPLIQRFYPAFVGMQGYLVWIFPLLILQTKFFILVFNSLKLDRSVVLLLVFTGTGVLAQWLAASCGLVLWGGLPGLAAGMFVGYLFWYLACLSVVARLKQWVMDLRFAWDLLFFGFFFFAALIPVHVGGARIPAVLVYVCLVGVGLTVDCRYVSARGRAIFGLTAG